MKQLLTLTRRGHVWRRFFRRQVQRMWNHSYGPTKISLDDWHMALGYDEPVHIFDLPQGAAGFHDVLSDRRYYGTKGLAQSQGVWLFAERRRLWCKVDAEDLALVVQSRLLDYDREMAQYDVARCSLSVVGLYQEHWWERLFGIYYIYAKVLSAGGNYIK